jgi:hypothetical protein
VAFESAIVNRSIVELPLNNLNRDMFPFGCLPAGMDWAILGDEYWWIGPKGIMGSIMMLSEGESSRCHLSEIKTFLDGLSFLPKKLIKMVEKDSGLSVDDMR